MRDAKMALFSFLAVLITTLVAAAAVVHFCRCDNLVGVVIAVAGGISIIAVVGAIDAARQVWHCRRCPERGSCCVRYVPCVGACEVVDPLDVMPEPPEDDND